MITIRPYRDGDARSLVHVFFRSVRELARVKYDAEQVRAWAPEVPDVSKWEARMRLNETFVAEREETLVGFIELERNGHLQMLYRSPGSAGNGVAEALYRVAEARARELGVARMYTEASLLAEGFFAKRCYRVAERETVERNGVLLARARMFKVLAHISGK
jgi:putative acetyltransferase